MRSVFCLAASLILAANLSPLLASGRVVTIAGTGSTDYEGDGGPATKAAVSGPFGISLGPDGALYVCEIGSHVVRRIDKRSGLISTVAGSGKKGYAGDGGPATQALLNEPYEVRFDREGNMFFVEMQNHIVRKVDRKSGVISTVAGTGEKGFSGDGGPATQATFSSPHSITFDGEGNLYICDIGNHRVRRVELASGIVTTFAGTGERKPTPDGASLEGTPLNGPRALDFDGRHSLFLALREGNAVYRIDLKSKTLHHIAGTGKSGYTGDGADAKQARLAGPKGVSIGPGGDIYLADTESHTIRVVRVGSGIIETLVGDGQQGDGPDGNPRECRLDRPHGVYVDNAGNVYIGDSSNHRVRKYVVASADEQAAASVAGGKIGWERVELDARFRSEGVAMSDVNRDGKNDVIAGDVWYENPGWNVHEIRTPGEFVAGVGYSNSFCNYAWDINGDGWDDMIYVGFPGEPFHWYENPKNEPGHWKEHLIWHSICNESPDFADITGDGKPELIFGSQPETQMGYMPLPKPEESSEKWKFHPISRPGNPMENGTFKYYHGLGYGDLNNDGRIDVLIPHGWWEAPEDRTKGPWEFHEFRLSEEEDGKPLPGSDIHVDDLDLDGDNDLIMGSAHNFGLWWFENVTGNEDPQFRFHLIDKSYSQTHASEFVDVNGDGTRDIVTGKRFYAHNGADPGGKDPVVMYWYEIQKTKGSPPKFLPHEIEAGRDTGVGTQFLSRDFDGDGLLDVILSNKKGVNSLLQRRE